MYPLPEGIETVTSESTVCELGKHLCDPYDPTANAHCSTDCWSTAHCLDYTQQEVDICWKYPGSYWHGGYCSPFGEPTWPTRCVDGLAP